MNIRLSEELKMLKEMAYKFAVAEFTPHIRECDEHEKYTPEIRRKAAQNGLVGAWIIWSRSRSISSTTSRYRHLRQVGAGRAGRRRPAQPADRRPHCGRHGGLSVHPPLLDGWHGFRAVT